VYGKCIELRISPIAYRCDNTFHEQHSVTTSLTDPYHMFESILYSFFEIQNYNFFWEL